VDMFATIDLIALFFFLGAFASWIKSDLEIPDAISKFLSIFLLLSLGLKGGHEVRTADALQGLGLTLSIGLASCFLIPAYFIFGLKRLFGSANAAALGACYGSVSAITFITAQGFLETMSIKYDGYMVAIMALMEIPAIIFAIDQYRKRKHMGESNLLALFSAKSVILLLGGFLIGFLMNDFSWKGIGPVIQSSFRGVLAFFLLDLGILAQRKLADAWRYKTQAIIVACLLPLIHGSVALLIAAWVGVSYGNSILLAVLVGSASYIAAPAAIRASVPDANPSLYVALPLALTFPLNVIVGIPFYIFLRSSLG
jgi:hypothetical protein